MEFHHIHFNTIDSTNTWASAHMATFDPKKITLITADEQTGGKGQYGRKWVSPAYLNIYASFCLFIEEHRPPLFFTALMSEAVEQLLSGYGVMAKIKQPNDLLVNERKIAGILTQTTPLSPFTGVIIGLGLNVNMPLAMLEKIDQPSTSLLVETGKEKIIGEVINNLKFILIKSLLLK